MTTADLIKHLTKDLGLDAQQRYELGDLARRYSGMPDEEVMADAHARATRATNLSGGATLVLATGIVHERFVSSLGRAERADYEGKMRDIGASGIDLSPEDGG